MIQKKRKNNDDIINYRLEKINKIIKKPAKKGFLRFFDEKNNSINASNIDNGSMSSKIFNKSGNKKNVTLRMLDFEENNYPNQSGMQYNEQMNSRIKYLSFLIYIISFIIYKKSLFSCEKLSLNDCIEQYNIQKIFQCFIKCVVSGLVLSINIVLIILKLLSVLHIFLLLVFLLILLMLDCGNNIYNHGLINFTVFFISLLFGFLFCIIIQFIVTSFIAKKYKNAILFTGFIIIPLSGFYFLFILLINCSYWNKGFKNSAIDNNKKNFSCSINTPGECYMKFFDNLFDFSSLMDYNCEKMNRQTFGEIIENYNLYYDTEIKDNVTVLNFPLTNNGNYSGDDYNDNNFAKKVISNIKGDSKKNLNNSEVFLIKNEKYGTIEMTINTNMNLANKRKKLEKTSSKINNIIFIYFDTLSRPHFHRKLKNFSSLLSELFYNSHASYESFEFLKYHTFSDPLQTALAMLYGVDSLTESYENNEQQPMYILSHLKQNGFITAQSANICSKHYSSSNLQLFQEEFDYENIGMFCDPNYILTNQKNANIKGINSSFRRCIYGKDSFQHVIDYGRLFWDAYPHNNKFLKLSFFDGNERTGEVVKYLDNDLMNFFLDIVNQRKFHKTALFLVSGKGEIEAGIFNKIKNNEYFAEKRLGSWLIVLNKNGFDEKELQNARNNMQNFVTPYDIYDTMLSLINNCYDENCYSIMNHRSKKGKSIFNNINGFERNCEMFSEIQEKDCHCIKY